MNKKRNIVILILIIFVIILTLWITGIIPKKIAQIAATNYLKNNFPKINLEFESIEWSSSFEGYSLRFKDENGVTHGFIMNNKYFPISLGQGMFGFEEMYREKYENEEISFTLISYDINGEHELTLNNAKDLKKELDSLTYNDNICKGVANYVLKCNDGTTYAILVDCKGVQKDGKQATISDELMNQIENFIKDNSKNIINSSSSTTKNEQNINSPTTKVVVVKINENDALVMGTKNKELYRVGLKHFNDIELKINQELLIYHDGMILTISPSQFGSIQKIELLKEESNIEIPEDIMRYAYSSKDNVNVTINELTDSSITLSITDTNKYPYEYSHSYTITQKIKNENYTGVGQYIGEKTNTSTQGYTRNWLSIFMERSK